MFQPFVPEVIFAKVHSSDKDGIRHMLVSSLPSPFVPNTEAEPGANTHDDENPEREPEDGGAGSGSAEGEFEDRDER